MKSKGHKLWNRTSNIWRKSNQKFWERGYAELSPLEQYRWELMANV